jgi:hypothetical protein
MLTTKNTYSGAGFDYSNTGFVVNGDWKVEDGVLVSVNFNGIYTDKKKEEHYFYGSRDVNGSVNISGVQTALLATIAKEVSSILEEVEAIAIPAAPAAPEAPANESEE